MNFVLYPGALCGKKFNVNKWLSYYCIPNPTLQKQGYVANINHKVLKECTKNTGEKWKRMINSNVILLKDGIKRVINGTLWTLCSILVPFVVKKLTYYCIPNPTLQKQGYVANINHKVLKECTKNTGEKWKRMINFNVILLKDGIKRVINGTLWTLCSILVPFVVKYNFASLNTTWY